MSSFTTPLAYKLHSYDSAKRRKIYMILEEFEYRIGDFDSPFGVITVPIGFLTDFASIPWPMNLLFKPEGKWAKAAVIHDYMLVRLSYMGNDGKHTRVIADSIFYEAMLVSGVGSIKSYIFYSGTRLWSILSNIFKLPLRIYK